jgi:hypothetical protein
MVATERAVSRIQAVDENDRKRGRAPHEHR